MKQRVRRAWSTPHESGRRARLLIEDDHPALEISDFSLFKDAGFDVAFCSGPGSDPRACPLVCGQPCALVAGADVVLHGLDPALGIAAAIRHQYPERPIVVKQPTCSVSGQIDALLRAGAQATDE
jgi:hypothetical protein